MARRLAGACRAARNRQDDARRQDRFARPPQPADAGQYRRGAGRRPRAAGRVFRRALGIALGSAGEAETLAASPPGKRRRIIIDTSGINPFDRHAVDALAALVRSARAEPVLVLPANVEPDEATEIAGALRALPIRRLLVTRLDIVRRLGGLLAAAASGGYAIVGGSITPHFTYGLRPLTPRVLARRLLSAALDDKRWRTE
jgi:flagellar biosynthesis protein FlhF